MTHEADNPLLSWDDLRILESIARDESKSMDEREEALLRLQAQLDMRAGFMEASHQGVMERFVQSCADLCEAFRAMGAAMASTSQAMIDDLTPEQRAKVRELVCDHDVPIIDAILQVTEPSEARKRSWAFRYRRRYARGRR